MMKLPPPPANAHEHPNETGTGTPPCGYTRVVSANCGNVQNPPPRQPSTQQPSAGNRGGSHGFPIGIGVGVLGGLNILSLGGPQAADPIEKLSSNGPQFPQSLHMSDFQVTGFVKGGWPLVVDYEAEQGTYVQLVVVTQNAPAASAVLAVPQTGRRLQLLRLPDAFGPDLKIASFTMSATASPTDAHLKYLRVYGFGCGPKAVGSVAIDQLRFGPQVVSPSQQETHFGFHAHTNFDKMKAEFMQTALVDNCFEGEIFDNKRIDHRVKEGDSFNDTWSAKKAGPGQIQFRVRGWMTAKGGGDWVSAFSPDLVLKQ